jgi:two-component system cell cycle response regulator DivK
LFCVLLVEDNEMNRDMLSRRLARRGWLVLLAVTGLEAVSMAVEHLPDVVLMDLSLPEMDGWTATRTLRENPRTRDIVVIALTAHAMSGDQERALSAGCDGFETKPIDFPKLLAQIESLMRQKEQICQ